MFEWHLLTKPKYKHQNTESAIAILCVLGFFCDGKWINLYSFEFTTKCTNKNLFCFNSENAVILCCVYVRAKIFTFRECFIPQVSSLFQFYPSCFDYIFFFRLDSRCAIRKCWRNGSSSQIAVGIGNHHVGIRFAAVTLANQIFVNIYHGNVWREMPFQR